MDAAKISAELDVLRGFVDFINRQVGVYCDCLTGFQGNKVRIERQVARVNRPTSKRIENGKPVIVWASVEDPTHPDILHHRIIRADHFIETNTEANFNEQQICRALIIFMYEYWNEVIRPQIAKIRKTNPNDIQIDAFGDMRILRNSILHDGGVMKDNEYKKLKVMSNLCKPNSEISFTHDQMHKIFVTIKNAIGRLILDYTAHLPGAPKPEEIVDIAIQ